MTVLPDMVDEATGNRIEGSSQVVDSRYVAFVKGEPNEEDPEIDDPQFDDHDHLSPEERDPEFELRLADTFEEINTTEYDVNPEIADTIAQQDLGRSPEAITVQYLASKVFNGDMTPEEAFQGAVESGLDMDKLMFQYYALKERVNG